MRLDLGIIDIQNVRFGPRTQIGKRTLFINHQELVARLEQEPLFEHVEVEIAHPGESCRIIRVLDVLEPRFRLNGPNFPGALDGIGLVGDGHTRALKNVAVVETSQLETDDRDIIDMSGPGAELTPLAKTHNVVLLPYPKKGADKDEYRLAVKKAGLIAATYLAAAAESVAPDSDPSLRATGGGVQSRAQGVAAHRLHLSDPFAATSHTANRDRFLRQ